MTRMSPRTQTFDIDLGTLGEQGFYTRTAGTRLSIDGRPLTGALASGVVTLKRRYGGAAPRALASAVTFENPTENKVVEIDCTATGGGFTDLVFEVTTTESGKKLRLVVVEDDPT